MSKRPLKKATAPMLDNIEAEHKLKFLAELLDQHTGISAQVQRTRIRLALARFSLTTVEIRRYLDVFEVGARICELRHMDGCNVVTTIVVVHTETGYAHRCALYSLGAVLQAEGGDHAQC